MTRFYDTATEHVLNGRGKELCAMLSKDFTRTGINSTSQGRVQENADKEETCDRYNKMFEAVAQAGRQGGVSTNYQVNVEHIEISKDRKSAEVKVSSSVSMALGPIGRIAETRDKSSETLVIRNGKLLLQKSEGTAITRTIGDRF
ncbi:hypothetical protein [Collimonas fungivorans]|uniref:hypothetical protein n=1 Tax=Collimonas fungivorans TaxID=158899 RepID=UPI000778212A|nr:hypothetical protein [Collimonas fungivorans]